MSDGKTLDEVSDEVVAEDAAAALDAAWLEGGSTFTEAWRQGLDERDGWVSGRIKALPVPFPEWGAIVAAVPENEPEKGGLLPGLHVVAAGTGVGKTQFAVSITAHALEAGALVAYFALELKKQEVAVRAFSEVHGAPRWSHVLRGRDGETRETLERLAETLTRPELEKRFGIFTPPVNDALPDFVLAKAKAMRAKVDAEGSPFPPLLVFDYTQLAAVGGEFDARKAVSALAKALRDATIAHDLVVIAISSVARSNYGNASKAGAEAGGLLPDGGITLPEGLLIAKESGEMEYCSNTSTVIVNVGRLESGLTLAALCVVKNREGLTRWAPAAFEGGRWQRPERGGKVERSTVAAYFREAKADGGNADGARKAFESAWFGGGAEERGGLPFLSTAAWDSWCARGNAKPGDITSLMVTNLGGVDSPPRGHSWHLRESEGGWKALGSWGADLLKRKSEGSRAAPRNQAQRPQKPKAGKK